jgi:hypothetical protein
MRIHFKVSFDTNRMWRRVMYFAFRQLCKGQPEGRKPVGIPGNRDPEMPCTGYAPRPYQIGDWPCETDGHYECQNCSHYKVHQEDVATFGEAAEDAA